MSTDQRIVVGYDGSDGAKRALRWAAEEARLRSATLAVVKAWTPGEFGSHEEMAAIAAKTLDEDVHQVLGDPPPVHTELTAQQGHASKVLLEHGQGAGMLVVGSRGHGGFTGLVVGSVSQQVSTHPGAPVVVIVR